MLKDKIAIVTGASRGIGRTVAKELAKAGAKVCVNYASSADSANELVSEIVASGGTAFAFKASVNNEEEVNAMFAETESRFGASLDILVNNAGITKDNLIIRMKNEEWDEVIDINLKGVFLCMRLAAKSMMKKRYGKIINISSVVGFTGNAGQLNYTAAKAGVIGMTKSAALELASRGIRVNAIAPGFIGTDMTAKLPDAIRDEFLKKIPLKEIGKPEDISKAVLYLASPDSDYMTGQTLHLNGGLYL